MEPIDKERAGEMGYLNGLIGQRVEYGGEPYLLIDVLPEGPQLVLQHEQEQSIQDDLQGRPYRRVPRTLCLTTLSPDGEPSELLDLLRLPAQE